MKKRCLKLRFKITWSVGLLIVGILLAAMIPIYRIASQNTTEQLKENHIRMMEVLGARVDRLVSEAVIASEFYSNNRTVLQILLSGTKSNPNDAMLQKMREDAQIKEIMDNYNWPYILSGMQFKSYLFSVDGKVFASDYEDIPSDLEEVRQSCMQSSDDWLHWSFLPAADGGEAYMAACRRIINFYRVDKKIIGALVLRIPESCFYEQYRELVNQENIIYLVDGDGKILSSNVRSEIGKQCDFMQRLPESRQVYSEILKQSDLLFTAIPLEYNNWWLVEETNTAYALLPIRQMGRYGLTVMAVCVALALFSSVAAGHTLAAPIEQLCEKMRFVIKTGKLDVQIAVKGSGEIEELQKSFNQMLVRMQQLLKDVKEREERKRDSEIRFLMSQINPHFLYNTLNTIRFMVSIHSNEKAEEMMLVFMKLLRRSLSDRRTLVPVEEELENLKLYISIERYRYSDSFEVQFEIDPSVKRELMPKFILQPIVENAIFHGGEPKGTRYTVRISIWRRENLLEFLIEDDGVGIDKEKLSGLLESLCVEENEPGNHIGLRNVDERLKLLYTSKYRLRMESEPGKGTSVAFCIPISEEAVYD